MRFFDLGFLFMLLPAAVAVYYCFPKRYKPLVLTALSLLFFCLISPKYAVLAPFILPDMLFVSRFESVGAAHRRAVCSALVCKNIIVMLVFGVVRPLLGCDMPYAVMALYLSATELLVYRFRGDFHDCSFFEAAAACTFFGRYFFGPVNCAHNLLTQLKEPPASVLRIARGIMYIIVGAAKQSILAEQLFMIFNEIAKMPPEQFCMGTGWLAALCGALGLYYTLSAVSDIAVGIAAVFSLEIPKMLYYPFQAVSLREYIYRLNFPLEDTVGRMFFSNIRREEDALQGYIISFAMPFILALWIAPNSGFLAWAAYMSALILLDRLFLRHIPVFSVFLSRIATFLLTLPAYLFLLPCGGESKLALFRSIFGIGSAFTNDEFFYILSSNWLILAVGTVACTSLFDILNRRIEHRFPRIWWGASAVCYFALFFVTLSFMLWNVR